MAKDDSPSFAGVVYFTGNGEDFPSSTPSFMQPLSGQPVLLHTLQATREVTGSPAILVVDQVFETLSEKDFPVEDLVLIPGQANLFEALESRFTGIADHLLLLPADLPLLTSSTLRELEAIHAATVGLEQSQPVITAAYFRSSGSSPHHCITRGDREQIIEITRHEANIAEHRELQEYSAGVYCVAANWFWEIQSQTPGSLTLNNLLSSLVQEATTSGRSIQSFLIEDPAETIKIDTLVDLSHAETIMRHRTNHNLMRSGVTITDPSTTYIDVQVEVGRDSVIQPNTYLRGKTRIGRDCLIGPSSMIIDTEIGDRCKVTFSIAESAVMENDVDIGPFAHLRKGAHLAQGVHIGNYGEVKNSYLGPGTKMGHFSYIGDANIGADVNIGAGVITANYDGKSKHPTEIGAGAFIGSDTMLIAPLKIGAGARTGAGSVVTKDVPPNSLAVGTPARIIRKKEEEDGP
jgi:bifunctional UDP-N-acetylglucosamine pyrophosphorylase/glucosamine-1-phosphate N-acetyltransferase